MDYFFAPQPMAQRKRPTQLKLSLIRIRAERDRSKGSPADCSRLCSERDQARVDSVEYQRVNKDLKAVLEEKDNKTQSLAQQLRAVEKELHRPEELLTRLTF
ncbi:hypothetical protein BGZ93_007015 [Podila epicladia]|nr:hypothetical protein BGZ93_007015 [Podila epicladia]